MNLLMLNEDCLMGIFKYLSLEEQLVAALAAPQLQNVLGSMWRRTHVREGALSCSETIEKVDFSKHKEGLAAFAAEVCDHTEEMLVTDAALLQLMVSHKWSKLRDLKARIEFTVESSAVQISDENFPALKHLLLVWDVRNTIDFDDYTYNVRKTGVAKLLTDIQQKLKDFERAPGEESEKKERSLRKIHLFATWANRFDVLNGKIIKNPRVLRVNGFDPRVLHIELMPNLDEIHFESPTLEGLLEVVWNFNQLSEYVKEVLKPVREKKKGDKPSVTYDNSCGLKSATFRTSNEIARMLRKPNNTPIEDNIRPFYCKLECDW